jgi:hypothetical protein
MSYSDFLIQQALMSSRGNKAVHRRQSQRQSQRRQARNTRVDEKAEKKDGAK